MTPAARAAAAIEILDDIIAGNPAEARLLRWSRGSRYAGSGDRAAVRDLVFDSLRQRRTRAALGGSDTGRGLILGGLRANGIDPATIFTGERHAPAPLTADEGQAREPTAAEAADLPDWVAAQLEADLGANFTEIAAALRDRAPVWLRVNVAKTTSAEAQERLLSEGIETQADPRCPTALCVTDGARKLRAAEALQNGLVELQDLSPQMACETVPVIRNQTLLDFCAGGGGKSLAFAARGARVTAWDAAHARLSDLPARAARAGAQIQIARQKPDGLFDIVVTDVPCSGSGTWRRTPDAKWRLSRADLDALVNTQAAILDEACQRVGPGGTLVYMTCSLFKAENEAQIASFLARNPKFQLSASQTLTPLNASDGFYVASLSR